MTKKNLEKKVGKQEGNTNNREVGMDRSTLRYLVAAFIILSVFAKSNLIQRIFDKTAGIISKKVVSYEPNIIPEPNMHYDPNQPKFESYIVEPNDTLSQIAEDYNMPMNKLAEDNQITDPNKIYENQILRVRKKVEEIVGK